ncbi:MAG: Bro-N domain-containing protein [Haliscomenobacter sp.]|nr:Bro-N domain-containing protein [Haliscomenobacter sp.]
MENNKIVVFESRQIRRVWHKEEWWFSVVDVVEILSESSNPAVYWRVLKKRLKDEGSAQTVTNCNGFKLTAADGKLRLTDCANTETMFRIIQSIPSPKAEPFKPWLTRVGYERIQEIENPELAAERAREYYQAMGYSEEWIERRMQSIAIRGQLTDEWKARGVQEGQEYAILTSEISRATFGLTPTEYKDLKSLKRENLRDHMTGLELIFTMLGEEATRMDAVKTDAQGFDKNRESAIRGGTAAGNALETFEKTTGDQVVTRDNFKDQIAEAKQQQRIGGKKGEGLI